MKINYLLSISALLTLSTATYQGFAQVKTKPAPSPKSKPAPAKDGLSAAILAPDPAVLIGKLPNGLTYYIRKNAQPKNRAELYLVNKAGSVLETDAQQGLAHFTEHMAFNGTKDFPKNELVNYLQKSGIKFGADLNAYTSFDETVYQLPLPTDSVKIFEKGFTILANWAGMVSFDTDEINSERGVVLEEERLRGKNASERMSKQTLPVILNNSRYALRLPIGKEDILKNFKPETIKSFYHDWYRPDLQAVVVVGDFDVKRVEELIKANFSGLKNPANEKVRTRYSVAPSVGTTVKIVTDKEQPYTIAQIIVKHPGSVTKTEIGYLNSIRNGLFNSMLNARLGELTQKADPPLLYGAASYGPLGIANVDAFSTIAVAKPGELEKAVKAAVAETERARKFGFNQTELDRAKLSVMTAMESAYKEKDKTKSVNYVREYQANFLKGEAMPGIEVEYALYKKFIDQIKLSEINALAGKFISDQDRNVIVQAPEKEKDKLPSEQTLLTWIKEASNGVTAYVDNVSTEPLLKNVPTGTKVVSATKDAAIGTTTLVFGNGVKAILKPTDFKNDQILINGFSFGGTSLASDADFRSATMSDDLVNGSGIAEIDEIKLDKMLTGKRVNISPYVSETTQGVNGSATPKDLETALQLVYLYYTAPRSDANIWQSTLTQIKSTLANRGLDPATVFADSVAAVLGNHNMRRMPTTLATLNEAKQDKAFAFYKDRFADASGTTFVITGSFDVEKIKPLLEQYLGGLPSTNRKETYKDLGIHAPSGQLTKTVYKGIGDKSNVQLVFSGAYDYNETNNIQLDALGEVLQIKLIERLREKESGVYSPGVRASYSKLPTGRYSIGVYFSCAPSNVEKLIAATMEEIAKIKKDGAQLVDIQKYTAEDKRSTEVQLKENGFWAGHLIRTAQYQENPDAVLNHNKDLEQVTVQSTKDAANKYLGDNLIKFILYPEKK